MVIHDAVPPPDTFTPAERRLIRRLRHAAARAALPQPAAVQHRAAGGDTLRSFRQVVRRGKAHCLEAALAAACILEQHGYPPLLMSLASVDKLDHVIFVYRHRGRWGSVARSRDPGLHGRKPVFRSLRALAESYFDPYIDYTGRVTGYAVVDLRRMGAYDWRFSRRNVWAVENECCCACATSKIKRSGAARAPAAAAKYRDYLAKHNKKPLYYRGRESGRRSRSISLLMSPRCAP